MPHAAASEAVFPAKVLSHFRVVCRTAAAGIVRSIRVLARALDADLGSRQSPRVQLFQDLAMRLYGNHYVRG